MYKCEKLNKSNYCYLDNFNSSRFLFNSLNKDFMYEYKKANFIEKFFIRKQVKIIKFDRNFIGYIWFNKYQKNHYIINSLNISEDKHRLLAGYYLLNRIKHNTVLVYECEKNEFNYDLLEKLGFHREEGTIELSRSIDENDKISLVQNVSFEVFIKGKHERIRCDLQNSIFVSTNRQPLTLEDIYFDEMQDYYCDEGAIFIKLKDEYIGYGQIIEDNGIPFIVNFGIINLYRNKGYGKLLLKYLIKLLLDMNFLEVRIKVDKQNERAFNLYRTMGFNKMREYYRWQLQL